MGQPVRLAAIFLEPLVLALKVCQPLFGGFELAGECRHAVTMRGAIIAAVCQFIACFSELFRAL